MGPESVTWRRPRSSTMAPALLPVSSIAANTSLAMRPEIVLARMRSSSSPSAGADTGDASISLPSLFKAEQIARDPVGGELCVPPRRERLEIVGVAFLRDQHVGVVGREAELGDEARLPGVGQFRQATPQSLDPRRVELQRQQIRVGEIAIVEIVFLGAHRPRLAAMRIEQARLLHDRAAVFENLDLAARLVLDRLHDEADRVDVLDLGARAELG